MGNPGIRSIGPIAFGPDGILFVADNASATITAIDVGEAATVTDARPLNLDQLDSRLAAYLGCAREDVQIRDMAVHPPSQVVYLSVMRASGSAAEPVLIKVRLDGSLSDLPLDNLPFSQVQIDNAPGNDDARTEWRLVQPGGREGEMTERRDGTRMRVSRDPYRSLTVTDLAYVDGVLLVAGTSNEEFSSTLRRIPFPFQSEVMQNSLEIFHVSHGRYETASPIRTFVPYRDNTSLVASYTCTPVVHFSLRDLRPGSQLKGRTVAELGSWNSPIDMVSYKREGQEYILVSNALHGLVKIACKDIDEQEGLTQAKEPVGVPRETMPQKGVGRMANLNGSYVLMIEQDDAGNASLRSYSNSSL
jgi:hypothetical protein